MIIGKLKRRRGRRLAQQRVAGDVARLFSGQLSNTDEWRMKNWHNESRDYQEDFLGTVQLMADMQPLADDPELHAIVGKRKHKKALSRIVGNWPKVAAVATILLVAAMAVYTVQKPGQFNSDIARHITRVGEQKTVNLMDGSTITLNTGTQLLVEFSNNSRKVILERGEVYFDVAPDPERIFTIDLGVRTVSVLGTAFNILKSPNKIAIAVMEGEVSIHPQEEAASTDIPLLTAPAGEVVRSSSAGQHRVRAGTVAEFDVIKQQLSAYVPRDIKYYQNWRSGIIRFDAVPLAKVVQELNRYSAKKILIEDTAIMDMKLYATVRVDQLNMAMTVLEHTLPVKVTHYFDRIVIEPYK